MGIIKKKVELKPCPFCGGEVEKKDGFIYGTKTFICHKCGADVMFYGGEKDPKATEKWNRRGE